MTPWASVADLNCSPDDPAGVLQAATEVLWVRSGRQFGTRQVTVRPCVGDGCSSWAMPRFGHGWPGTGAWPSCSCVGRHDCGAGPSEISLGIGPLLNVQQVKVDGEVIADADREVQEETWLVYLADPVTGNPRAWPTRQRLDVADTEEGTFSVTALVGVPVPELGRMATVELACSLAGIVAGDDCSPANATAMVKDGVSYDLISIAEALVNSHEFPLPLVTAFVDTYNPKRLGRRARVLFPPPRTPRRVDSIGS